VEAPEQKEVTMWFFKDAYQFRRSEGETSAIYLHELEKKRRNLLTGGTI